MNKTLFYGDSMLIGSGLDGDFVPGRTIADALRDEDKEIGINLSLSESKYKNLVICLGTNDLASYGATEAIKLIKQLLDVIIFNGQIFIMGWPHESEKTNWLLESSLPAPVLFIPFEMEQSDFSSDGVHLNASGFAKIIEEITFQLEC